MDKIYVYFFIFCLLNSSSIISVFCLFFLDSFDDNAYPCVEIEFGKPSRLSLDASSAIATFN